MLSAFQRVKSLQDSINLMVSDFMNNMQEDTRSTIMVVKNYGGEPLGGFRQQLNTYGAIAVDTSQEGQGGVDLLKIDVNSSNYEAILKLLKKALIENARGYDAKDDRIITGQANQMRRYSRAGQISLSGVNARRRHIQGGNLIAVRLDMTLGSNFLIDAVIIASIKNELLSIRKCRTDGCSYSTGDHKGD